MCKKILFAEPVGGSGGVALFLLRVISGAAFVFHGWPMIQHPFNWMGVDSPVPAIFQGLAAFSEFAGGFALLAGLLTRLAALGIWCVMAYATLFVHLAKGDPFVSQGGSSYELAAVYWVIMTALALRGPGIFSLDSLFFKKS